MLVLGGDGVHTVTAADLGRGLLVSEDLWIEAFLPSAVPLSCPTFVEMAGI
jgi:hypothetical protein